MADMNTHTRRMIASVHALYVECAPMLAVDAGAYANAARDYLPEAMKALAQFSRAQQYSTQARGMLYAGQAHALASAPGIKATPTLPLVRALAEAMLAAFANDSQAAAMATLEARDAAKDLVCAAFAA